MALLVSFHVVASPHHLATEVTFPGGFVGMSLQVPRKIVHRDSIEAMGTLPLSLWGSVCWFLRLRRLCQIRGSCLTRCLRGSCLTRGWRGSCQMGGWWWGGGTTSSLLVDHSWGNSHWKGGTWRHGSALTAEKICSSFIAKTAGARRVQLCSGSRWRRTLAGWRALHLQQTCLACNWCVLKPYHVLEAKGLGHTEELLKNKLTNIKSPAQDILPQTVAHIALLPVVAIHHANDELDHVWANTIQDDMLDLANTSE